MELWTEGQRTRWLTARQVLADLIEERGCKAPGAANCWSLPNVADLAPRRKGPSTGPSTPERLRVRSYCGPSLLVDSDQEVSRRSHLTLWGIPRRVQMEPLA